MFKSQPGGDRGDKYVVAFSTMTPCLKRGYRTRDYILVLLALLLQCPAYAEEGKATTRTFTSQYRLPLQFDHTLRCARTNSSVSSAIAPAATRRPLSRMQNSLATRRANGSFCSTNSIVRPSSLFSFKRMSPI